MNCVIYVALISIVASISGILFGYDTGVISGAMLFLKKDFVISANQEGAVVSILLFGGLTGSFLVGKIADRIGRKNILIVTSVLYIFGTLGLSEARSLHEIYVFRFILGIPIGIATFATPGYISEISPKKLRGLFVSFFQLSIVIGILLTYLVNYFFFAIDNAWRNMFLLGVIPAFILLFGLLFLPESPRWLISKGKDKKAEIVLSKLRGSSYTDELMEIKSTVMLENTMQQKWGTLFNKTNFPVFIIAATLMLLQQFSGIDAIIYYAPQIFINSGLGIQASLFSTVLIGIVNLIATIFGIFMVDKLGRRVLMIIGSFFMAVSLMVVAVTIQNPALSYIGIGAVLCYIFAFATSTGIVGWLIISEIFPLKIRGKGTAIGVTFFWLSNILVSFLFPILIKFIGIGYIFGFFASTCIISLVYCTYWLPETRNVSLETIEQNLINQVKSRDLGKTLI